MAPTTPTPEATTMRTYIAIHKGKTVTVEAETQYQAQRLAAAMLKARKPWDVVIALADVVHTPDY